MIAVSFKMKIYLTTLFCLVISVGGQQCSFDEECTSYTDSAFCYKSQECHCYAGYKKQAEYCNLIETEHQECPDIFTRCPPKVATAKNVTDQVVLQCKLKEEVEVCKWLRPDNTEIFPKASNWFYHKANLMDKSTCNLKLLSPKEFDHGNWTCIPVVKEQGQVNSSSTNLLVMRAPEPKWPLIVHRSEVHFPSRPLTVKEGEEITVQCLIKKSRPQAQLSWYLSNGDVVKKLPNWKSHTTVTALAHSPPDVVGTKSSLTFIPERKHHQWSLNCEAKHEALENGSSQNKTKLNVLYKPVFSAGSDDSHYVSGSEAKRRVRFNCNPPPKTVRDVKLLIDDREVILPGRSSLDGRVRLSQIVSLQRACHSSNSGCNTTFEVTVTLSPISAELTKQTYTISVTNHISGPQGKRIHFHVYGSGKRDKEPWKVAAWVILILVVVFGSMLTYFTWMKSKWCFKQPPEDDDLLIPESPEFTVKSPMLHK